MKKIISIILGILLMFSMSITSFAAMVPVPETTASTIVEGPSGIVTIVTDLKDPVAANSSTEFITKIPMSVKITNDTTSNISLSDINISVVINTPDTENPGEYIAIETTGEWSEKEDFVINKDNKQVEVIYTLTAKYNQAILAEKTSNNENLYVIMINDKVNVACIHGTISGEDGKMIANGAPISWAFNIKTEVDEDTSTSTDTSAPSEPEATDKEETSTSTTQPSIDTPEVTNPATPETEEPSKAPADVDDYIPDTGAATPIGAIGTLIGSAVAAVIAKKRKKINE